MQKASALIKKTALLLLSKLRQDRFGRFQTMSSFLWSDEGHPGRVEACFIPLEPPSYWICVKFSTYTEQRSNTLWLSRKSDSCGWGVLR